MNPLVAGAKLSYGKLVMIYWQPSQFEKSWVRTLLNSILTFKTQNRTTTNIFVALLSGS